MGQRGRKPPVDPPKVIGPIRIPESLHTQVHALLVDPRTGKIEYGALNELMVRFFKTWIEAKRAGKEELTINV